MTKRKHLSMPKLNKMQSLISTKIKKAYQLTKLLRVNRLKLEMKKIAVNQIG